MRRRILQPFPPFLFPSMYPLPRQASEFAVLSLLPSCLKSVRGRLRKKAVLLSSSSLQEKTSLLGAGG